MLLKVLKWPRVVWKLLIKYGLLSGFVATMLGVLAAFWLTGLSEQKALNRATLQRLHIVVLESEYNGTTAKKILDDCASSSAINIRTDRPATTAAAAALQDANIPAILPPHKISLLRTYVNAVATLNKALDVHQSILESIGYEQKVVNETVVRETLRSESAAVFANAVVLQEQLSPWYGATASRGR